MVARRASRTFESGVEVDRAGHDAVDGRLRLLRGESGSGAPGPRSRATIQTVRVEFACAPVPSRGSSCGFRPAGGVWSTLDSARDTRWGFWLAGTLRSEKVGHKGRTSPPRRVR